MNATSIKSLISNKRTELGLTQAQLGAMAGVSRRTIQNVETGKTDVAFGTVMVILDTLSIPLTVIDHKKPKSASGLWMAAKSASVSYKGELSPQMLEATLSTGVVPTGFAAHVGHLLDESPIQYVIMAVSETAEAEHKKPAEIWANVGQLAKRYSMTRADMWAAAS